jgi:hypothetical protein
VKIQLLIKDIETLKNATDSLAKKWDFAVPMKLTASVADSKRNLEQNAKMWSMLSQLQARATWHGVKLSDSEWKDLLTAGLKREQKSAQGLFGGLVYFGSRTSRMSVSEMSELIEFMIYIVATKPEGLVFDNFIYEVKNVE